MTKVFTLISIFILLSGCAAVNFDYPKTESMAFQETGETYFGKRVTELSDGHPDESGFYFLVDGVEALAARLWMMKRAERSIDVQYFLIKNDLIGYTSIGTLLEAADRGVRVRLLIDDILTKGYDTGLAALDSHPHIEVRVFNPFAGRSIRLLDGITNFRRINRRMHNKSITVDNQITIIGGRNIAAEYFSAHKDMNFGDVDVIGVGSISRDVSFMFDTYWNHRSAVPVNAFVKIPKDPAAELERLRGRIAKAVEEIKATPYAAAFWNSVLKIIDPDAAPYTWAPYELVYDSPDKSDRKKAAEAASIVTPLAEAIGSCEEELIIVSPYFVPLKPGIEYLGALRDRGVEVTVVTNSLAATNHSIVHSGYAPSRKPLLKKGVKLYEARPDAEVKGVDRGGFGAANATLHTKGFIVDRRILFLGSFNWTPRSFAINTELGVIIDSPQIAKPMAEAIDQQLNLKTYEVILNDKGKVRWVDRSGDEEIELKKEPQTGFLRRLLVRFYGLLPIKRQL